MHIRKKNRMHENMSMDLIQIKTHLVNMGQGFIIKREETKAGRQGSREQRGEQKEMGRDTQTRTLGG